MKRTTEMITVESINQIPSLEMIKEILRYKKLKIIFEASIQNQRQEIGENLKKSLEGFQIGIHISNPEINIAKLITDKEIEEHQLFFENCAKDYRDLSRKLIFELAKKFKIKFSEEYPYLTFNKLKGDKRGRGKMGDWKYFFHGFHCCFENQKTGQTIEVPLVFGLEFGDLDPYFFSIFIKSTPEYQPLPVEIYEDYADGARINDKMLSLGKFERINSNFKNHSGIVVTDRDKIEIKEYVPEEKPERKFSFWKFIGLKK